MHARKVVLICPNRWQHLLIHISSANYRFLTVNNKFYVCEIQSDNIRHCK